MSLNIIHTLAAAGLTFSLNASFAQEQNPAPPLIKYNFTNVITAQWGTLEIDKGTMLKSEQDEDSGLVLSGAVFRVTTKPVAVNGVLIVASVNAVIAMCGTDSVMLVNSKQYDPSGKQLSDNYPMQPYQDKKQAGTPPTEMYKLLCNDVVPKSRHVK